MQPAFFPQWHQYLPAPQQQHWSPTQQGPTPPTAFHPGFANYSPQPIFVNPQPHYPPNPMQTLLSYPIVPQQVGPMFSNDRSRIDNPTPIPYPPHPYPSHAPLQSLTVQGRPPIDPEDQETSAMLELLMNGMDVESDNDDHSPPGTFSIINPSSGSISAVSQDMGNNSISSRNHQLNHPSQHLKLVHPAPFHLQQSGVKIEVGRALTGGVSVGGGAPHWPQITIGKDIVPQPPQPQPPHMWQVDSILWQCRMKTIPPAAAGEDADSGPLQLFATPVQWAVVEGLIRGGSIRKEALLLWPCCSRPPGESVFLTFDDAQEWRRRSTTHSPVQSSMSQSRGTRPKVAHPPALGADDHDEPAPQRRKPQMVLPVGEEPPQRYAMHSPYV